MISLMGWITFLSTLPFLHPSRVATSSKDNIWYCNVRLQYNACDHRSRKDIGLVWTYAGFGATGPPIRGVLPTGDLREDKNGEN
jgi:hypothetical protein